ncbi:MAG: PH domain-containing protein [Candidatus Limimorpha sp.]
MKYSFVASHLTRGNVIFPDRLEVDEEKIVFYKAKLIGHESTVIQRAGVGSVSMKAGLLFADIIIETKGGQVTVANGFSRSDAKQILELLSV